MDKRATDRLTSSGFKVLGVVCDMTREEQVAQLVERSRRTTGITVLFHGGRRPTYLHRDYITQASG